MGAFETAARGKAAAYRSMEAKSEPKEGSARNWYNFLRLKWIREIYRNGQWVEEGPLDPDKPIPDPFPPIPPTGV